MTLITEIAIHKTLHKNTDYIQIARIENQRVVEIDMEPLADPADASMRVGDIYYAKVVRLLANMRMAFVEIGEQRTALLHFAHVPLPQAQAFTDAAQYLRVGQLLPVQVTKLPRAEKGAVVTGFVQLVGALLIYQPYLNKFNISQRITEEAEKKRLKTILNAVVSENSGVMVRSLAESHSADLLLAEWRLLLDEWAIIQAKITSSKKPQLLRAEWPQAYCYLRDQLTDVSLISVDDPIIYTELEHFMQTWLKPWQSCLRFTPGKKGLWQKYKIDSVIENAVVHKINLPSGGFIVVETTEAMITVDVNTGQYVKASGTIDIVYQTNLEAALTLAQHLRLCNLAGIIVVDFIGMKNPEQQQTILAALQQALTKDPAYTSAYGFSPLGLVEMSRQRRGHSWIEYYKAKK